MHKMLITLYTCLIEPITALMPFLGCPQLAQMHSSISSTFNLRNCAMPPCFDHDTTDGWVLVQHTGGLLHYVRRWYALLLLIFVPLLSADGCIIMLRSIQHQHRPVIQRIMSICQFSAVCFAPWTNIPIIDLISLSNAIADAISFLQQSI